MKRYKILLITLLVVSMLAGCAVHQYTIGTGPQGMSVDSARQWYILFGLVPLNNVDIAEMVDGAEGYEIRTAQEPMDIIFNIVTSYVTISSRTVTVKK